MNSTEKTYIGKGTQVNDYDMFNISIDITAAQPFFYEYEGRQYLSFTFAKMQKEDVKGRTFTAYVKPYKKSKSVNQTVKETNAKAAKKGKAKKADQPQNFQMQH
jgi:hypothetical protein